LYYLLFVAADDNDDAPLNDGDYFIAGNELSERFAVLGRRLVFRWK
jgi:hypothetical protein